MSSLQSMLMPWIRRIQQSFRGGTVVLKFPDHNKSDDDEKNIPTDIPEASKIIQSLALAEIRSGERKTQELMAAQYFFTAMLLTKTKLDHPKLSDGTDVLKSFQWDSITRNQQLNIPQPKSPTNANRNQHVVTGASNVKTEAKSPLYNSSVAETKTKYIEEFQQEVKHASDDFKLTNKINLQHRLGLLKENLSPYLNVEMNEKNVLKLIEQNALFSKENAYWSYFFKKHGYGSQKPNFEEALLELKRAKRLGCSRAESELISIREKYNDGHYGSLVQSFSKASVEIIEESSFLYKNSLRAKTGKFITNTVPKDSSLNRLSSNPAF